MSETPRTDAVIMKCYKDDGDFEYVESDFTRQLERELAAAQAENATLKAKLAESEHSRNHTQRVLEQCEKDLRFRLAESEKGKVNLGKLANATRRRLSVLNCHPYTINEIDSLICNWMEGGGE